MTEEGSQLVVESAPIIETISSDMSDLQKTNLSQLDTDSDYQSLRKEIKYARSTVKRLEKLDKLKAKKIARKAGLISGVKRANGWLTGLKQWNTDKPIYSIPKRGTKDYDAVMAIVKTLVPEAKPTDVVDIIKMGTKRARKAEVAKEAVKAPRAKRVKKE